MEDPRVLNKIYHDALQQSYINAYMVNVVILGPLGSGKTHLLHLLMSELPPQDYHSTPLWTNPIQDLRKLPTTSIRCKTPTQDIIDQIVSDGIKYIQCKAVASTATTAKPSSLKKKLGVRKNKQVHVSQELVSMPIGASAPFEVGWIHYLDTGGQPQFRHILPLFVQHVDCKVIVFNMSESPGDDAIVGCASDDAIVGCASATKNECPTTQEKSIITNKDTIVHCVRLLKPADQHESSLSKVVVVGTHLDYTGIDTEAVDKGVQSLLNPVLNKSLLYNNPGKNKLIFTFNVSNPHEDENVANDLHTAIMSLTEHIKPTSVPLRWMLFHQEVKVQATTTNAVIMEFEACSKIANCLFMSDEDVVAALDFFAEYNIFMYYKSILPCVVFTNPQALSDAISCLVVNVGDSSRDGIVSLDVIREILGSDSPLFKHAIFGIMDFVNLLLSLRVMSRCKNEVSLEKYFMPAVLTEIKEEISLKDHQTDIQPLLIYFSRPLVPSGTFCRLIVSLLSFDSWQVAYHTNTKSPMCAHSNCIKLLFETHTLVTLFDHISFIEIHAESESACFRIKSMIIKELDHGMEKPQIAFYCPCELNVDDSKLNGSVRWHTAAVFDNVLVCSADEKRKYPVQNVNLKHWFYDGSDTEPCIVNGKCLNSLVNNNFILEVLINVLQPKYADVEWNGLFLCNY